MVAGAGWSRGAAELGRTAGKATTLLKRSNGAGGGGAERTNGRAMTPTSRKVKRGKQTADGEGAGLLLPYPRRFDPKFTIFFEF